jgi:hypothetical protein
MGPAPRCSHADNTILGLHLAYPGHGGDLRPFDSGGEHVLMQAWRIRKRAHKARCSRELGLLHRAEFIPGDHNGD